MQMSRYNFSKTSGLHLKMALKTAGLIWLEQSRIRLKWNLYGLPATLSSPASTLMYWKSSSDMSSLISDPRITLARVSSSSEEAEVSESQLSSEDFEVESDDVPDDLALETLGEDLDSTSDEVPDEVSAPKNDSKDNTDRVSEESLSKECSML